MLKTVAIEKFLKDRGGPVAQLYHSGMEVQVNVRKCNGSIVEDSSSLAYTDGLQVWKPFRIPWKDGNYSDSEMTFPLDKYAEAIGMTGWDYREQCSRWVAFDFDSIIGHKKGLTNEELREISERIKRVPYCGVYKSTSGSGIHIYINIKDSPVINNHNEHAAIATAILYTLAGVTGIDLVGQVDIMGGNMWIWHSAASDDGFTIIQESKGLCSVPENWREYVKSSTKRRVTSKDSLVASQRYIELDEGHQRLLKWFESSSHLWWWNQDKGMLVCHTYDLAAAHKELKLNGLFSTISTGRDRGHDQNCFCFPMDSGSWSVRRHGLGTRETNIWFTDNSGWTTCFLNRLPSLRTATSIVGGVDTGKEYYYHNLTIAIEALKLMGFECPLPQGLQLRSATITQSLAGKVVISFAKRTDDPELEGWAATKSKWLRTFFRPINMDEIELPDGLVRHIVAGGSELGWSAKSNDGWVAEPRQNVVAALISKGKPKNDIEFILGACILNNWKLVNKPFEPEYPGKREWNRDAPQLRHLPVAGVHPTWDTIFEHLGRNIPDGRSYLQTWVSCLIRYPSEPLPYITFVGPQNCGKSIFHETLQLLFIKGYIRADSSLTSGSGFNGELANAILCIVEETNLSKAGYASDRIKDWVTGRTISIRALYRQSYDIRNCTHWVQCTNDASHCPIFPGDTRITLIQVEELEVEIPKYTILQRCEQEAPAFLHTIMNLEIPEATGRLRIPVINTAAKISQQELNRSDIDTWITEQTQDASNSRVTIRDAHQAFTLWAEDTQWTNRRFTKELRMHGIIVERAGAGGQMCIIGKELFDE